MRNTLIQKYEKNNKPSKTSNTECVICQKCKKSISFNFMITRSLYSKYSTSQNYYYSKDINDIFSGNNTALVVKFKDYECFDERVTKIQLKYKEEFLKRFFQRHEYNNKMNMITEYYKFHNDVPRMFMLPLITSLNKFHDKKRKIQYNKITKMLKLEEEQHTDFKKEKKQNTCFKKDYITINNKVLVDLDEFSDLKNKINFTSTKTIQDLKDNLQNIIMQSQINFDFEENIEGQDNNLSNFLAYMNQKSQGISPSYIYEKACILDKINFNEIQESHKNGSITKRGQIMMKNKQQKQCINQQYNEQIKMKQPLFQLPPQEPNLCLNENFDRFNVNVQSQYQQKRDKILKEPTIPSINVNLNFNFVDNKVKNANIQDINIQQNKNNHNPQQDQNIDFIKIYNNIQETAQVMFANNALQLKNQKQNQLNVEPYKPLILIDKNSQYKQKNPLIQVQTINRKSQVEIQQKNETKPYEQQIRLDTERLHSQKIRKDPQILKKRVRTISNNFNNINNNGNDIINLNYPQIKLSQIQIKNEHFNYNDPMQTNYNEQDYKIPQNKFIIYQQKQPTYQVQKVTQKQLIDTNNKYNQEIQKKGQIIIKQKAQPQQIYQKRQLSQPVIAQKKNYNKLETNQKIQQISSSIHSLQKKLQTNNLEKIDNIRKTVEKIDNLRKSVEKIDNVQKSSFNSNNKIQTFHKHSKSDFNQPAKFVYQDKEEIQKKKIKDIGTISSNFDNKIKNKQLESDIFTKTKFSNELIDVILNKYYQK